MNIKRLIALVLCTLLTLIIFVSPTAKILAAVSDYDYSRAGSYFNTTLTSADILKLLGYELSDAENAYLDEYGQITVKYETVTSQAVSIITVDGATRVNASSYTYTGANGLEVTWTPVLASLLEETKELRFVDGVYIADFDGTDFADGETVSVKYTMNDVSIKSADINSILNLAYTDALALKDEMKLYTENAELISDYFTALALYEKYVTDKLVYDQKKAEYNKYLNDVLDYEAKLSEYEKYLLELEEYTEKHEKVQEYDLALKKYEENLGKYNKYLSDLELAERQLKMLNDGLMNTVTYLDRQLYGCFFANLVDRVVANKDKFTLIGASADDIEAANSASKNIRTILKPNDAPHYVNLKTTEEKYEFYINNYESLRDNIILLTRALYSMYSVSNVRNMMHIAPTVPGYTNEEDYTERFVIFISQLICFSNALSDQPITDFDGNVLDYNIKFDYWKQDGTAVKGKTILEILEGEIFVEDLGTPEPLSLVKVKEPTHPGERPEDSEPPTLVVKPIAPNTVYDPGSEPSVVQKPERPAAAPEDESRLEILENEIYIDLVAELECGSMTGEREELSSDVTVTPTVTVKKGLNISDMVDVSFLDTDGTVITTIGTPKGSAVNFTDRLPEKADDVSAAYAFDRWVNADGEAYDLSCVMESVILYPSFKPIYKEYAEVKIDGIGYLDVDYTGHDFADIPLAHFLDVANSLRLGLLMKADNVTLNVPYSSVVELVGVDANNLSVAVNTSSLKDYYCRISLTDSKGIPVTASGIHVSIPCDDSTFAMSSTLSYLDADGTAKEVSKLYSDGEILIRSVITGATYSFKLEYALSNNTNLNGVVTYPKIATPGDVINLEADIPLGTAAEFYYAVYPDLSTKHKIEGNSFVMPYGDVRIGATFTVLEYTVKFISDGKVISEKNDYKYGDTVRVPNNPTKTADGTYSYAFVGWSPNVSTVTGDAIYVANFEATPLPKVEEKVSLIVILVDVAIGVLVIGVPTIIVFILDRKKVINVKGVLKTVFAKLTRGRGDASMQSSDNTDEKTKNVGKK